MEQRILILLSGILAVTLFDAAGSIAFRKMKININAIVVDVFFNLNRGRLLGRPMVR